MSQQRKQAVKAGHLFGLIASDTDWTDYRQITFTACCLAATYSICTGDYHFHLEQ